MRSQVKPRHIKEAQQSLGILSASMRLMPAFGEKAPKPDQEARFLLQHPDCLEDGFWNSAAHVFANEKQSFGGLSEERQRLAASLIAATFNEEQLLEIAASESITSEN